MTDIGPEETRMPAEHRVCRERTDEEQRAVARRLPAVTYMNSGATISTLDGPRLKARWDQEPLRQVGVTARDILTDPEEEED